MISFGAALSAIRSDPRWARKVMLGVLVNLIPYVGAVALLGWSLDYMRRVAWGQDGMLPEWTDFWQHARRGLYGFLAVMPYSLAISALLTPIIMAVALAVTLTAMAPALEAASAGGSPDPGMFAGMPILASIALGLGTTILAMPLYWAIIPLVNSAYVRVALYDRLEAGFQFREIWDSMKVSKPTLRRAWGRTVILGVLMQPLVWLMFVPMAGLGYFASIAGDMEPMSAALSAAGLAAAIPLTLALATFAGVFMSLATSHWWGVHARAAYRLAPATTA